MARGLLIVKSVWFARDSSKLLYSVKLESPAGVGDVAYTGVGRAHEFDEAINEAWRELVDRIIENGLSHWDSVREQARRHAENLELLT